MGMKESISESIITESNIEQNTVPNAKKSVYKDGANLTTSYWYCPQSAFDKQELYNTLTACSFPSNAIQLTQQNVALEIVPIEWMMV